MHPSTTSSTAPIPPDTSPLFFLMTTRPPRSTLFPYTTLFRSSRRQEREHAHSSAIRPRRKSTVNGRWLDRKSTRLNSSHVSISYAVFCLKKKKQLILFFIETKTRTIILFYCSI